MAIKEIDPKIIREQIQKEERQIVDTVMEKFYIAKSAKEEFFNMEFGDKNFFDRLLSFYLGRQLGKNPKTTDVILNNITPIIQSAISTILEVPLSIELIPGVNSTEQQIKQIKELEIILLFYWTQHLEMIKKIKELLTKVKIWGTGFLYPHYNIENNLLNIRMDVINPECIYPDPSCNENSEAEFIFYCEPIPLTRIRRWYPERGKFVKEEFITSPSQKFKDKSSFVDIMYDSIHFLSPISSETKSQKRNKMPSANLIFGFFRDDTKEELAFYNYTFNCCNERFSKKNTSIENIRCPICRRLIPINQIIKDGIAEKQIILKYPRGRMIVIANEILLDDRPNPYYDIPFIRFININTTKYWGLGDVEYLISEQIAINKLLSMGMRIIKKTADRPVFVDENTLKEGIKSTDFGDIIEKLPGTHIQWMDMPPLPVGLFEMSQVFRAQMDNKTGLRDRSRIKTATEATLLDEEEQRRQVTLLGDIEKELKKVILHILHILTNYHTYTEQLALDYKQPNMVIFKGIDYQNLLFNVNVRFQTEIVQSKMVKHKQALESLQTIISLLNSTLITQEEARQLTKGLLKDLGIKLTD